MHFNNFTDRQVQDYHEFRKSLTARNIAVDAKIQNALIDTELQIADEYWVTADVEAEIKLFLDQMGYDSYIEAKEGGLLAVNFSRNGEEWSILSKNSFKDFVDVLQKENEGRKLDMDPHELEALANGSEYWLLSGGGTLESSPTIFDEI